MSSLGKRLKRVRENSRLTQQQVADKMGISNGTLSGYERDYRDPDTDTLNRLAVLYGVSIDFLLGRTADPKRVLKEQARTLIDLIDLDITDDEIMGRMNLRVDGLAVEKDEVQIFIRLVREGREKVRKALQEFARGERLEEDDKKNPTSQGSEKQNKKQEV